MCYVEGLAIISVWAYNLNNLRYAYDTVLIVNKEEELQDMINRVVMES